MNTRDLVATGLTQPQADAYLAVIESGSITPPLLAKKLGLTRTNAYKLLDKLAELGIVRQEEKNKKLVYSPDNPMALTNLAAEQRNEATAREEAIKHIMKDLLSQYHQTVEQPDVHVVTGRDAVVDAYKAQIQLLEPIFFVRTRADIPALGFDTMHEIRVMPARHGSQRYGITPDVSKGPTNPKADKRSNLERTWIKHEDYSAPVEWSVSNSTLLIVLFGDEPHAITITNPLVARAFKQLWSVMNTSLRAMPYYKTLPRTTRAA